MEMAYTQVDSYGPVYSHVGHSGPVWNHEDSRLQALVLRPSAGLQGRSW